MLEMNWVRDENGRLIVEWSEGRPVHRESICDESAAFAAAASIPAASKPAGNRSFSGRPVSVLSPALAVIATPLRIP